MGWRKSIEDHPGMATIIEYKELVSIADLLVMYGESTGRDNLKAAVHKRFRFRVVMKAHYWLMLHYWCFFLDFSCENQRRHPFLREDIGDAACAKASSKRKRTRTEMEVCIGQIIDTNNPEQIPSNYAPYTLVRKANCPTVPPPPRWPTAYSYCLTKPVGQKCCPKEQYPEYEWTWDWEQKMQDSFAKHAQYKNDLFDLYLINDVFENARTNINPTSLIYSVYPWSYDWDDYTPRTSPWTKWYAAKLKVYEKDRARRLENLQQGQRSPPKDEIIAYEGRREADLHKRYEAQINTQAIYGKFIKEIKGDSMATNPHYPVNRVYKLYQADFIDFNGWAFWDTEDAYPNDDYMGPPPDKRTPTHMDVAKLYRYDENWATKPENKLGGVQLHLGDNAWAEIEELWAVLDENKFRTGGILMEYCCLSIAEDQEHRAEHNLHWPDGHLCVYAHGAIDATNYKFKQGNIGWDCENGDLLAGWKKSFGNKIYLDPANEVFKYVAELSTQQRLTHGLPTGLYNIQFDGKSEQYFSQHVLCMKEDIRPEVDIEIPRDAPFYLMMYQHSCQ